MSEHLVKRLRVRADRMATIDSETCHEAADRIEELEAKLAKAVGDLDKIKRIDNLVGVLAACERTIAELKGEDRG